MFNVDYCDDDDGRKPAEEFIDGLGPKMKAKVFGRIELLEEYGNRLGMPYARHLEDGIWELRTVQGTDITRVMYFFVIRERVLLTHGFIKKTQKTPQREIDRAKRIRASWKERHNE